MRPKKSDLDVQNDVIAELKWEPSLREDEIAVVVREGVVTLGGFVESYAQKVAAEHAVKRVEGVKGISQQIEVRLADGTGRTDTELTHRAVEALRWDVEVPEGRITPKVEDGWVTLEGVVDWRYQGNAAERAVRFLFGVKGVTNLVAVKPRLKEREITKRIADALRRHADREATGIRIATKGSTVTLEGTVDSWEERQAIERAAWSSPGVSQVFDRLTIGD